MSLSPAFLIEDHEVVPVTKKNDEMVNYTILGNMPTSMDIVATSVLLPKMSSGDKLAVLDTGAYNFPFNNNFAGPRPGVVMIKNGKFEEVRRRETFDDMMSLETTGIEP